MIGPKLAKFAFLFAVFIKLAQADADKCMKELVHCYKPEYLNDVDAFCKGNLVNCLGTNTYHEYECKVYKDYLTKVFGITCEEETKSELAKGNCWTGAQMIVSSLALLSPDQCPGAHSQIIDEIKEWGQFGSCLTVFDRYLEALVKVAPCKQQPGLVRARRQLLADVPTVAEEGSTADNTTANSTAEVTTENVDTTTDGAYTSGAFKALVINAFLVTLIRLV